MRQGGTLLIYVLAFFGAFRDSIARATLCRSTDLNFANLVTPLPESASSSMIIDVGCREGYKPARNTLEIRCLGGEWEISEDPCVEDESSEEWFTFGEPCFDDPPEIENGKAVVDKRNHGHYIRYECQEGAAEKSVIGSVRCYDGTWIGHPPKCDYQSCQGDPPEVVNGKAVVDERHHGHYIRYECQEGTQKSLVGSVRCHDGTWIGHPPKCDFQSCFGDPPEIENGKAVVDKRHHGHYIRYDCQGGMQKSNIGSVRCHNGTWIGNPAKCDFQPCYGEPPEIENGKAVVDERRHGHYIRYECQEGIAKSMIGNVHCHNGSWIGNPPKCDYHSCFEDPPEIENGKAVVYKRLHGSLVRYDCQDGTKKVEMGTMKCHNGTWIGIRPRCDFKDCSGNPPEIENGKAVVDERSHGHYIRYECQDGTVKSLIGGVRCHDGTWIGYPPKCELHSCFGDPPEMENGMAVVDRRHHGHVIRYECLKGTKKIKIGNVRCHNGTWIGDPPNCDLPRWTKNFYLPDLQESLESSKGLEGEWNTVRKTHASKKFLVNLAGEILLK